MCSHKLPLHSTCCCLNVSIHPPIVCNQNYSLRNSERGKITLALDSEVNLSDYPLTPAPDSLPQMFCAHSLNHCCLQNLQDFPTGLTLVYVTATPNAMYSALDYTLRSWKTITKKRLCSVGAVSYAGRLWLNGPCGWRAVAAPKNVSLRMDRTWRSASLSSGHTQLIQAEHGSAQGRLVGVQCQHEYDYFDDWNVCMNGIKWWNVAVSSLSHTYTSPLFWNALDFSALRMEYLPDQNRGTLAEDEPFPCSLFYHVAAAHFPQHIPQMPESGKWSPVPEPPWGPSTPSWSSPQL